MRSARARDAKMPGIAAASSLARLWREHGRRTEAHELLEPIYGWFTEGFDTADLERPKCCSTNLPEDCRVLGYKLNWRTS